MKNIRREKVNEKIISNNDNLKKQKTKRYIFILAVFILIGLIFVGIINKTVKNSPLAEESWMFAGVGKVLNQNIEKNKKSLEIGDKAVISSVALETKTGTGPWDEDDEPGNDSSEDNDIVRSFDQVTWTTELTMKVKDGAGVENTTGGTIEFQVRLPENCANLMEWNLDGMKWIEDAVLSEDGTVLTGKYTMSEQVTTTPGKQTLVFVLNINGAQNGKEIQPTFTFNLAGNEENEKVSITANKIKVSATGKYNIQLHSNTGNLSNKVTVDYGKGEVEGRMYGYGFTVQLANESESKGLKGIELPQGEISFDVNLKLERTKFGSEELEDITNEAMPIIWNYRANNWDTGDLSGNIEAREMYYSGVGNSVFDASLPLGVDCGKREYSTYNSGNIKIDQKNNILHITINEYGFDKSGKYPMYNSNWNGATERTKIYTDNIGTFIAGYMQIFVPDTEASTMENRNYYFTVSDDNMNITSSTQGKFNVQGVTSDDSIKTQHIIYKQGSGYNHEIAIFDENKNGTVESKGGDGKVNLGDVINVLSKFCVGTTNDYEINTANRFIKFDGQGFEPIYYDNGKKYEFIGKGNAEFKVWYVTKKDGANWTSQEEMNNSNIEDMDIYENIEDIPESRICVGIYVETISGYISKISGWNNNLYILLKIKDTAPIGKTYGITERTWYWKETLDRGIYTITNPDVEWPEAEWDSGNREYIKTEYDEDGNIVTGTNSGGKTYGNTVLVVGANLYGNIRTLDSTSYNTSKVNYDLGKNENIVLYSIEPQLDANENLASQIDDIILKAEVILPKGLTYVPGSSKRGEESYTEPEIIENEDGSTTLVWHIYGVTSGEKIEPILFETQIDNNSKNNTQYITKFIVSEVMGTDGISKIGNSEISYRTSSTTINIINLSTHRLYKETNTQIMEKNGEVKYTVTYQNNADSIVPDFQLLDVLPYNGDGRGTTYTGTYTLKDIQVTQTGEQGAIALDNLKLYITTKEEARNLTAKDEIVAGDGIWEEKVIGEEINEEATAIALKGVIANNTSIELKVTLQTIGNKSGEIYSNSATAQTNKDTEPIMTTSIKSSVVKREIRGKVWIDNNENGIIDNEESYAEGIEVKLKKKDRSDAIDYNGNKIETVYTNVNGEYSFKDLPQDEYIVEIKVGEEYKLTKANVGNNIEINSKFEEKETGEKESYVITKLNGIQSPEIVEEYVNAGLVSQRAQVIVHHYLEGTGEEYGNEAQIISPDETIDTIIGNTYETKPAEVEAKYELVGEPENARGTVDKAKVEVYYYYKLKDAIITEEAIEKTSNITEIKNIEETIEYEIEYKVKVEQYVGKAEITIVDTLPYKLAKTEEGSLVEEINLDGGTYDEEGRTITWTETVEGIDTYTEETAKEITITKNIEVKYEGINVTQEKIVNTVTGKIKLETPEKESDGVEDTVEITQNFKIDIEVEKVWSDNENAYGKRPEKITIILKKANGEEVARQEMNIGGGESTYTFADLEKYDEQGEEIKYTVEEESIKGYRAEIKEETKEENSKKITITNTYSGAIIETEKEISTEKGLSYVVEGEKITYTINIKNTGEESTKVLVKDSIPEGTTFVAGSIKVNEEVQEGLNAENLAEGIEVEVAGRESSEIAGEGRISFEVIVNKIEEGETEKTIRNTAYVNKELGEPESTDEPTNEVKVPVLIYAKKAEIIRTTTEEIKDGAVTAGDRIKYTITINNIGEEAIENVEITDTVPEGTTIYKINDNGEISLNGTNEIVWQIAKIDPGEKKEVSFEVTVNYDTKEKTIENVGQVDGKETNKVETEYKVPEVVLESSIIKDGTERITSAEEKVSYTINYKAEVEEFKGKGKLTIVDYLPYEIDEANLELNGGTYNKEAKTITWEEDIGSIDTYSSANGKTTIERTKTITLKYIYPDEENLSGTIENRVEGTISLIQEQEVEDPEKPEETITKEVIVKEETKEDNHKVEVEIPTKVIVHHYIYDEAKGGETTERVPAKEEKGDGIDGEKVADEEIKGIVGQEYETKPSNKVNANYECVNTEPEKHTGTMTKTEIEVTYYYKLKEAELGAEIEKTAEASEQKEVEYETGEYDDEGNPITASKTVEVLTKENGVVTYKIKYRAGIKEYQGRATIKIVDYLPAELATTAEGSLVDEIDLDGGTYSKEAKTITWIEEVEVDTFTAGKMYDETFEKEIKVVYKGQNVVETLVNTAEGTITIYYPEEHSTTPGGERDTTTVEDTAEVEQEYKVAKEVEKVWDDNNNAKGKRPESVTVQLTANGNTIYNGQELEKVVLNEANGWSHTFTNLPKYDGFGNEIAYSVIETETNIGDLEYYDVPVITTGKIEIETGEKPAITADEKITVTNKYKLMDTDLQSSIEKAGTEKITSSKEKVSYNISYNATVTDYIGEAVVTIVDTLPYKIDVEKSELAGGTYDEATQTITWKEKIDHINTYTDGDYKIETNKTITVVYDNLDVSQRNITNQVKGTIDLYETEKTNTVEDTHTTIVEIPGKVIVKYIDKESGKEITYMEEQEGQEPEEKTYGYEISGLAGDPYTTERKEIPSYTYIENSGNTAGKMIEGTIEVTYYYERTKAGGVHVTYVDEDGNEIAGEENYTGRVGDLYKTEQKDIYGYEYVRVEGNTDGYMTEGTIEVVYVYKKIPAKVIVRYLEKDETPEDNSDNKVLYPEETIEGYVGDSYTTNRKEIVNYKPAEPEPDNKEGNMTEEDIYVIYYYEKIPSGKVIVKYVDIDTMEEILYKDEETGEYKTYREESQGYIGEKYETEAKEIVYYKLVEETMPANKEGKYTEEDIYVTYYYEKQEFNIGVDKNVVEILINGEEQEVLYGKLNKVEVVGSKIDSTKIEITYSIKVSNTGEVAGIAKIEEDIPENFELNKKTGEEWKETEDGKLEAKVELKAGETKELKVVLNWIKGDYRFGVQKNTVRIIETENPANYEETTTEDNESSAEVVLGVKTGDEAVQIVLIIGITGMIIGMLMFIYLSDKYAKECKKNIR